MIGRATQGEVFATVNTGKRRYRPVLTATMNRKGVCDVDTVKGCAAGMARHPRGCYGDCYAARTARMYGIDFTQSISRRPVPGYLNPVLRTVASQPARWYRIGVAGDPSHDWANTVQVCELLRPTHKVPVIVTKHWTRATDNQLARLATCGAVFNTSVSGMDSDHDLSHRLGELKRVADHGMRSVCRVVTCNFGRSSFASRCRNVQEYLLSFPLVIDTPFRTSKRHPLVECGDILLTYQPHGIGGGSRWVSLWRQGLYLGACSMCPDQCGVEPNPYG